MSKLLLAEDDEFSRDMLARRLERSGFTMLLAGDGKEAIRLARAYRPDLILIDLDMPVMDGRTAIAQIRSDPRTFRIPIIVLTAHTSPEDVTRAANAGCQGFEAKPVVLCRLLARIAETLGQTAATSPATPPESAAS